MSYGAGVPIVRWLVSKRAASGGWSSTQDTVVALQALAAFAAKTYSPQFDVTIDLANGDDKHSFSVKPDNALVLQQYQVRCFHIPQLFTILVSWQLRNMRVPVELSAHGSGVVFAQVAYHWHTTSLGDDQPFACTQDVHDTVSRNLLLQSQCHAMRARCAVGRQ